MLFTVTIIILVERWIATLLHAEMQREISTASLHEQKRWIFYLPKEGKIAWTVWKKQDTR